MEASIYRLLSFLNLAEGDLIAGLPGATGKPMGPKVASLLVDTRNKYKGGFSDLAQLQEISHIGDTGVKAMLKAFSDHPKHPGFVQSGTRFTLAKGAPKLPEYEGRVIFEKAAYSQVDENLKPLDMGDEAHYDLYYAEGLDKEQLFRAITASPNFRSSSAVRVFAMQMRNNQFVATSVPNNSVYSRSLFFANKFKIHSSIVNPHPPYNPWWAPSNKPNPYLAVAISTDFYGNQGVLNFSESLNRVGAPSLGTLNASNYFDISGIIGTPTWAAPDHFKSFNILNFKQSNITASDPREYIAASPSLSNQNALVGSNNQIGWYREHQIRYVEVLENISVQAVHNASHSGAQNVYLNVNNVNGDVSAIYVNKGAAIPATAKFDMFVFYGYWNDRKNISCRVAFKSRYNGRLMGLNDSLEQVNCGGTNNELTERTSFYVEQGWGTDVNAVALKTFYGKYLLTWQNGVGADSVVPINAEQFYIHIP